VRERETQSRRRDVIRERGVLTSGGGEKEEK